MLIFAGVLRKKQVPATLPSDPFFVTSIWVVKRSLEKSILGKVQDPLKMNECPLRKETILKGNESSSKHIFFGGYVKFRLKVQRQLNKQTVCFDGHHCLVTRGFEF